MQILVISGFLGAGKTTFIKKLVEMTGERFVVLENEYGQLPVDGSLLQDSGAAARGDLNIWELTEGCICCSVKADFATSILTIANTLDPKFLIVEPTGVGMLSNIIRNIGKISYDRIRLLRPITIIDANCFEEDLAQYDEIYCDQIAHAGRILLSKTERMAEDQVRAVAGRLRTLAESPVIETGHYDSMPADWWRNLLQTPSGRPVLAEAGEVDPPDLESVAFEDLQFGTHGELVRLLESTIRGDYGIIKRAKGCVKIGGLDARFDVVSGSYSITGIAEPTANNAVFIGRRLNAALLEQQLAARQFC